MVGSVHMHFHGSQASRLRQVHSLPTVGITLTKLVPVLFSHWIPTRCWQIRLEERNKVLALIDDVITYIEHRRNTSGQWQWCFPQTQAKGRPCTLNVPPPILYLSWATTGSLVMSHIGKVSQPLRDFTGSQTGSIWRLHCMARTAHVHINHYLLTHHCNILLYIIDNSPQQV